MSLKDNMDFVKDELTSQEQFLSSFVSAERFFKKHKNKLIAIVAVAIVASIGLVIKNYIDEENKINANQAFSKFLTDPNDAEALAKLKDSNEQLYQIANYMIAKKENKATNIDVKYLKELNEFDTAIKNNDIKKLEQLSMNDNFLLKEYAIFYRALLLAQNGKIAEAKKLADSISTDSSIKELVNLLKHYIASKG